MARAHYDRAARETPGADAAVYRARADRQTRDTLRFVPRYYGLAAAHLAGLVGSRDCSPEVAGTCPAAFAPCAGLLGLTLERIIPDLNIQETSDGNWSFPARAGPGRAAASPSIHASSLASFEGEIAYKPWSWPVAATISAAAILAVFFGLARPDSP